MRRKSASCQSATASPWGPRRRRSPVSASSTSTRSFLAITGPSRCWTRPPTNSSPRWARTGCACRTWASPSRPDPPKLPLARRGARRALEAPKRPSMSVDRATVRRIARLARLAVTEAEEAKLEKEVSGILDWVAQLDEIDTNAVPPMTRVASMTMKMRKDEVTDGFRAADILKNAPEVDDGYFVVPKFVE